MKLNENKKKFKKNDVLYSLYNSDHFSQQANLSYFLPNKTKKTINHRSAVIPSSIKLQNTTDEADLSKHGC